jgi:hypothetical protein
MGKLDRRHSLKMNQRKAQAKKKIRLKKPNAVKAAEAAALPPRKPRVKITPDKPSAPPSEPAEG